jgi:starch synthase (maltosyl-transferring)
MPTITRARGTGVPAAPTAPPAAEPAPSSTGLLGSDPADQPADQPADRPADRSAGRPAGDATPPATRTARTPRSTPRARRAPLTGRLPILDVEPVVDHGRRPAKAVVGEPFPVSATVFREGRGTVAARVVLRGPHGRIAARTPMREPDPENHPDRLTATVAADAPGRWTFTVEAWSDPVADWREVAAVKIPAGQDVELTLEEGASLLERAADGRRAAGARRTLLEAAAALRDTRHDPGTRLAAAHTAAVTRTLADHPVRDLLTVSEPRTLVVHRRRALFGSWYELFPRSEGAVLDPEGLRPPRSGTFRTAAERLPAVAAMGFDVVYLPPVHPIGLSHRKGKDNALTAGPYDVGSPWAVGSPAGGHDAVHPELGTIEDFDAFVARTRGLGMEVALDFALQCSPDHPWVGQHPEWFHHRADGSVAYAENPPKKYQDIYPIAFDTDFEGIVAETLRVLRHWMDHGVRIFRVDNPHTKPVAFWERVLGDIARTDPDVLFLAEAFTRPPMMLTLAKIGFHQSYTYFTWRTSKDELTAYLTELATEHAPYLRPNFFPSTPDILPFHLQHRGPHAFALRAVLAATLSPSWGMCAGYELAEDLPVAEGTEEAARNDKYELRPRDWAAAEAEGRSLAPFVGTLNAARRAHPALQELRNIRFHHADNDRILVYSKRATRPDGRADTVVCVVNLDPRDAQEATVHLDLEALGRTEGRPFTVRDELTGESYTWGRHNYVRLDPAEQPAHLLTIMTED